MSKNKEKSKNPNEKLEIAQKIASTSPRVARTYASIENAFVYVARSLSGVVDWILKSPRISRLFALVLAVILYLSVNVSENSTLNVVQSATLNNIPVVTIYNSEMYEISGIPESVNVIVQGDMSNITLQRSQTNSNVVCDLSGLTEGTYTIRLVPTSFNSSLTVNVLDTPSVTVTIKKKTTSKFNISYEFINMDQLDSRYTLANPVFDTTEVVIRASEDTIKSISFVKAYIDASNRTTSFTDEARVVAYDNNGNIVDCDIIPSTVQATVDVVEISKEVPIIVRPSGTLLEGYAIDEIALDHATVTLYAPASVLNLIDAVYVDIDTSTISTVDTVLATSLATPSGVNSMSVTRINMEITLAELVSKTVEKVPVSWINYDANYKFQIVNEEDATMDIVVSGTANNIDAITADDITVNIDLSNITVGQQQAPLVVSGNNLLVTYTIASGQQYVVVEVTE